MSCNEKKFELMKKLKALATRGVGGEQANARAMLDKLMKKYGVSEVDLDDDNLEDHEFRFHSAFEKKILVQVIYKIATGRDQYVYRYGKGSKTILIVRCTKAEAIQIGIEYDFYKALWDEDVNLFLLAFIHKHEIFDTKPGAKTSTIDNDTLMRMAAMIRGMQDRQLHPLIEGGE